jgi:hypothetical protein
MAATLLAMPAVARAQGTVTGQVTAAGTNEPLGDARVMVVNTSLIVPSGGDGRYTLRNVPTGNIEVRVLRVGYQEQKKSVAVSAGASVTVNFTMTQAVVQLQEIVTTATGDQRRVELGNAISTLGDVSAARTAHHSRRPARPRRRPASLCFQALTVGPGDPHPRPQLTRYGRQRHQQRADLNRRRRSHLTGDRSGHGRHRPASSTISTRTSRDIEIVKGLRQRALYGTNASNGVIVITTKKGHASDAWTWYGEGGGVSDRNSYPTTYAS